MSVRELKQLSVAVFRDGVVVGLEFGRGALLARGAVVERVHLGVAHFGFDLCKHSEIQHVKYQYHDEIQYAKGQYHNETQ